MYRVTPKTLYTTMHHLIHINIDRDTYTFVKNLMQGVQIVKDRGVCPCLCRRTSWKAASWIPAMGFNSDTLFNASAQCALCTLYSTIPLETEFKKKHFSIDKNYFCGYFSLVLLGWNLDKLSSRYIILGWSVCFDAHFIHSTYVYVLYVHISVGIS